MDASTVAHTTRKLALGVVGLGRMGKQHALNALHYVPEVRLHAVCSLGVAELEWAEEHLAAHGVRVYKTFDDMIMDSALEALLIASTTNAHRAQVIAGVKRGLHVLCEKPLAFNLEESREILQVARQASHRHIYVMVAFSRRFDESYQNAATAIQQGRIGTPAVVRCENRDMFDRSEANVNYLRGNAGIFIDSAVHDIDLTFSFLGAGIRPRSCHAIGTTTLHKDLAAIKDVDNAVGTVEWYPETKDAVAPISYYYLSRIMRHGFDNSTEIIGTNGALKVNIHPRRDLITVADSNGLSNAVMPDFFERYKEAFPAELSTFARCILQGLALPYDLELAVRGMEIAEALQESLRTGRSIYWNESGERSRLISSD